MKHVVEEGLVVLGGGAFGEFCRGGGGQLLELTFYGCQSKSLRALRSLTTRVHYDKLRHDDLRMLRLEVAEKGWVY